MKLKNNLFKNSKNKQAKKNLSKKKREIKQTHFSVVVFFKTKKFNILGL